MNASPKQPVDFRVVIYRALRIIIAALCIGGAAKLLFGIIEIQTDQMNPALKKGDRVLVLKSVLLRPWVLKTGAPVLYRHDAMEQYCGCLRIAARAGDTAAIDSGAFMVTGKPDLYRKGIDSACEILPFSYSPRDAMEAYAVPAKNDTLPIDSLSIRDIFFLYHAMRGENPKSDPRLAPSLFFDGKDSSDYYIEDFALYEGSFDAIPDSLSGEWFFWIRLEKFFASTPARIKPALSFTIFANGQALSSYRMKNDCLFLLGDNWREGYDSRYFGPISEKAVMGRPLAVLWSVARDEKGRKKLRSERLFKLIR